MRSGKKGTKVQHEGPGFVPDICPEHEKAARFSASSFYFSVYFRLPQKVLFLMRRSAADVQACGSLLWYPGLYIRRLAAPRVCKSFRVSASEHLFRKRRALLLKASPVTAKTTLWFLDGTDTFALVAAYRKAAEWVCSLEPSDQKLDLGPFLSTPKSHPRVLVASSLVCSGSIF